VLQRTKKLILKLLTILVAFKKAVHGAKVWKHRFVQNPFSLYRSIWILQLAPWIRWFDAGFLPRKPVFNPNEVCVRFVVNRVALVRIFFPWIRGFPASRQPPPPPPTPKTRLAANSMFSFKNTTLFFLSTFSCWFIIYN
jgi:hypothetical protein